MSKSWPYVLQVYETARSKHEAEAMLNGLACQTGFLGGRVIGDGRRAPWAVQGFFSDEPGIPWLPDGVRRVLLPPSLARELKIEVQLTLEVVS